MSNHYIAPSINNISIKRLPPKEHDKNKINIHGKFTVDYDSSGLVARGFDILNHIILVVTRSGNYQSVTPFKDVIVFEDDVQQSDAGCSGSFNIDLFTKILFDGEGDYYILCSIGSVTSNILHIKMTHI